MQHQPRLTISTLAAIALALSSTSPLLAQPRHSTTPPPTTLRYIESSIGLQPPQWDGGRTEIEFADLNLDGHPDLVSVGDHGSPFIGTDLHGVSVWFGDGHGRWSSFQNGNFGYGGVAVGDVNNDGLPDVGFSVHHNYSSSDFGNQLIEVALGDGTGRNWSPWDDGLATNGETYGMFGTEFLDADADGFLDVASNSFGCCSGIHVYRNNRDGSWSQSWGFIGANSTQDIAAGDVNNDGFPDLIAASSQGTVWLNDGHGVFTNADMNLPPGGNQGREGPALGDVDADGRDDLAFITTAGAPAVFSRDPSSGQWSSLSTGLPTTGSFEMAQFADLNNDGRTDLAAFGQRRFAAWLGDGHGNWSGAATFTLPGPGYMAGFRIGDVDHNGYPDVAIVSEQGTLFNSRNEFQFFREDSIPDRPTIRLTSPTRHRVLRQNSAMFIDWLSAVPAASLTSAVSLEISFDGSAGPWYTVAVSLPNNGRYQTTVPANRASTNCFLRATVTTSSSGPASTLIGPFTITLP